METYEAVRFYLLGKIEPGKELQTLTTFAEWRHARGLARIELNKSRLDQIIEGIGRLRGFVEGGLANFAPGSLQSLGTQLFDIVLSGRPRDLFLHATGAAKAEGLRRLPLEIVVEDYAVAGWPWEYLYDVDAKLFISQEFHPISRSIFTLEAAAACKEITGKIRILVVLGVLPDDPHTSPQEELKSIYTVFSTHLDNNAFEIRILDASNYTKLQIELQNNPYDIVHYFGHAGFSHDTDSGYLAFARPSSTPFRFPARDFARLLRESGTRLVFLNACKTAQGAPNEGPARSSVAGALLSAGIPAVIGSQFSLPDQSAHFLAATIYNALLVGRSLDEAMRSGRNSMCLVDDSQFFDWGIPVLYAMDPTINLFPGFKAQLKSFSWAPIYDTFASGQDLIRALNTRTELAAGEPAVAVDKERDSGQGHKYSVALIDIDSKVGFLPDLVAAANKAQTYYKFEVFYIPVPSGYVRYDLGARPETYLPRLEKYLLAMPRQLAADFACCLTQNPVAGDGFSNHFAAATDANPRVFLVSTCDVREYAEEVSVPFAKAVLALCLSMLAVTDGRWSIEYHDETVGCLFDYCETRADLKVGLAKMRFDHQTCREKIGDVEQLEAIDALAQLDYRSS